MAFSLFKDSAAAVKYFEVRYEPDSAQTPKLR